MACHELRQLRCGGFRPAGPHGWNGDWILSNRVRSSSWKHSNEGVRSGYGPDLVRVRSKPDPGLTPLGHAAEVALDGDEGRVGLGYADGAGSEDQAVFLGGALDRRDRVTAVVAHQVHHFHAIERAAFAVRRVVRATREESDEKRQHGHRFLPDDNFVAAPTYTATPMPPDA